MHLVQPKYVDKNTQTQQGQLRPIGKNDVHIRKNGVQLGFDTISVWSWAFFAQNFGLA